MMSRATLSGVWAIRWGRWLAVDAVRGELREQESSYHELPMQPMSSKAQRRLHDLQNRSNCNHRPQMARDGSRHWLRQCALVSSLGVADLRS
jgi:hypothetical protein